MSIHWQNHSDAKRGLAELDMMRRLGGGVYPVLRHALTSILNRSSLAMQQEQEGKADSSFAGQ